MKTVSYFSECKNSAEVKALYRGLLREIHPDNLTRLTQELNAEYDEVARREAETSTEVPAPEAKNTLLEVERYLRSLGMSEDSISRIINKQRRLLSA